MAILTVKQGNKTEKIEFNSEKKLSDLLRIGDTHLSYPCGGQGICKKCLVYINGKEELSCKYVVNSDVTVVLPEKEEIVSVIGMNETNVITENICLCLDIGTTTLALALVSKDDKKIIKYITDVNPQRKFGADVIARIKYCSENGVDGLHYSIIHKINEMIDKLIEGSDINFIEEMFVSGNTTMLHLFFGVDCSSLGVSPYEPQFIGKKICKGNELGVEKIKKIESLPGISAFIGADIVSGLGYVGENISDEKYSLLIDLGTNAEIVLFKKNRYYSTSAAAGPCFEGANISCGMSASDGAIFKYNGNNDIYVIGEKEPVGLCATGLIDVIAYLLRECVIDESGYMDGDEYKIAGNVSITARDIREFQLAKSAVLSAIKCLMKYADIDYDDIEAMYVAGGFSDKLNINNAAYLGLLPRRLTDKFKAVNNSSLLGTIKYACEHNAIDNITQQSEYVDLGNDETFTEMFFENMSF